MTIGGGCPATLIVISPFGADGFDDGEVTINPIVMPAA